MLPSGQSRAHAGLVATLSEERGYASGLGKEVGLCGPDETDSSKLTVELAVLLPSLFMLERADSSVTAGLVTLQHRMPLREGRAEDEIQHGHGKVSEADSIISLGLCDAEPVPAQGDACFAEELIQG